MHPLRERSDRSFLRWLRRLRRGADSLDSVLTLRLQGIAKPSTVPLNTETSLEPSALEWSITPNGIKRLNLLERKSRTSGRRSKRTPQAKSVSPSLPPSATSEKPPPPPEILLGKSSEACLDS